MPGKNNSMKSYKLWLHNQNKILLFEDLNARIRNIVIPGITQKVNDNEDSV